MVTLREESS